MELKMFNFCFCSQHPRMVLFDMVNAISTNENFAIHFLGLNIVVVIPTGKNSLWLDLNVI